MIDKSDTIKLLLERKKDHRTVEQIICRAFANAPPTGADDDGSGEATTAFTAHLTDYKTSKGAIQFPVNKPMDFELISDIVKWRLENLRSPAPAAHEIII